MATCTVLISGGGVAGPTLAYWLARKGFSPTVVERAEGPRSSGNPVDVRGAAVDIAGQMGVMSRLRDAATQVTSLRILNRTGSVVASLSLRPARRASGALEVEIPRSDLAAILLEAGRDDAEYVFGESIASMAQDDGGVEVTFTGGDHRRFDLVVGADGLHSNVRQIAFGPDADSVSYLGMFVATLPLGEPLDNPNDVLMYNAPGKSASIHPGNGRPIAALMFRSPERTEFDHRDTEQHKRMITEAFSGERWRVPELLRRVRATDELYFDALSQVRLPSWSKGRVTLLGDAASCVSLFGEGSSLAIVGAYTLAAALGTSGDPAAAFQSYETTHRSVVTPRQRGVARSSRMLVPSTRLGIAARNLALRAMSLPNAIRGG